MNETEYLKLKEDYDSYQSKDSEWEYSPFDLKDLKDWGASLNNNNNILLLSRRRRRLRK